MDPAGRQHRSPAGGPFSNTAYSPASRDGVRSELVQKIATESPHLLRRDVERVVNVVMGAMTEALGRGERVELRGFGSFSVGRRDARAGRNPKTGESVEVGAKLDPKFRASKIPLACMNGTPGERFDGAANTTRLVDYSHE